MAVKIREKNGKWWLYVVATLLFATFGAGGSRAETLQQWRTPTGGLYFGDNPPPGSTVVGEIGSERFLLDRRASQQPYRHVNGGRISRIILGDGVGRGGHVPDSWGARR